MKKTISVLLALLLLLGTVSFALPAAAEEHAYAAGDILEYGTYPQSLVTDEVLLAAPTSRLRSAANTAARSTPARSRG